MGLGVPISTPGTRQQYQTTQKTTMPVLAGALSKAGSALSSARTWVAAPKVPYANPKNPLQPWNSAGTFGTTNGLSPEAYLAMQAAQASMAMSDAEYNARRNELLFNQGQAGSQRDRSIANLQSDTTSALNQIAGDKYRTVDLGLEGVNADRAYWDAIAGAFGQETQNLANDQTKQREFLARALGIEVEQLDALTGYAGEERGLADKQAQLSYNTTNRQAWSDATARGAVTSSGFADTRSELLSQLGISQDNNALGYREKISDIGTRRKTAYLSSDRGEQTLAKAWSDREVDTTRSNATVTRGRSDADRAEASLKSLASDYGLKEGELKERMRRGAEQANIDYASTVQAIQNAMASNDASERANAMAIAQTLAGV